MHRDVKMLVVACNSVEVSGLGDIAVRAGIPVVGVIDPGRGPPSTSPAPA